MAPRVLRPQGYTLVKFFFLATFAIWLSIYGVASALEGDNPGDVANIGIVVALAVYFAASYWRNSRAIRRKP